MASLWRDGAGTPPVVSTVVIAGPQRGSLAEDSAEKAANRRLPIAVTPLLVRPPAGFFFLGTWRLLLTSVGIRVRIAPVWAWLAGPGMQRADGDRLGLGDENLGPGRRTVWRGEHA